MVQAGPELIYHPNLLRRSVGERSDRHRLYVLILMERARASIRQAGRPMNMMTEMFRGQLPDGQRALGSQGTEVLS